ncbi:anhydro-N-acetylmuramic acid kinase [Terrihabitans rhizophilus]|uniref:Anhydro-N-acetylmuramic acid kinase n=1 Tax=Terrihabitans rhizophilus TaxID=3092662 RepID=A0ABU4RKR0_9HYPH|nr:anhydro-N-acetylmuramic acid kinase [Terrihabitans sp. PJ23]MDX6805412.1 anhydro-N-acetylmuramic acid kinase [Terrihabitans sp. PJ23]
MWAIGMMSGTSLDGIDIAMIETDGETVQSFGPVASYPYDQEGADRPLIFGAMDDARDLTDRAARPGRLAAAEEAVTRLNRDALLRFLEGDLPARPDVVGFHGQTVVHRPQLGLTLQLGDGAALASAAGIPVIHDLRQSDMEAGGQGAPLVPVFHRALVRALGRSGPVVVLNLGGVANITYLDGTGDELLACDVGPANALLDDFMLARTGQVCDENGAAAAAGRVDEAVLARLMSHEFFRMGPPKSLDRNEFRAFAADVAPWQTIALEDGAATMSAFTAAGVASVVPYLPKTPDSWIVCGGGAHNATLIRMLRERLAPARVETGAEIGWSVDHIEAQAFAFLAVRSLRGLPLSFPGTTGVPRPQTGGVLASPGPDLPRKAAVA